MGPMLEPGRHFGPLLGHLGALFGAILEPGGPKTASKGVAKKVRYRPNLGFGAMWPGGLKNHHSRPVFGLKDEGPAECAPPPAETLEEPWFFFEGLIKGTWGKT